MLYVRIRNFYDLSEPNIEIVNTNTRIRDKYNQQELLERLGFRVLLYECAEPVFN